MIKHLMPSRRFLLLTIIIASVVVILIVVKVIPKFNLVNKLAHKPSGCLTGRLSSIGNVDFVNISFSGEDNNFYEQIKQAQTNIRISNQDYNLKGILFTGGSLSNPKPYFYFVSVNQKKVVTTDGTNILYSNTEPFASNRGIIEDKKINSLLSPMEVVNIAKPILNCYKDYPENINREVYLYIDNKTAEVIWIVTVKDAIQSIPGPNVSHSVKIDAFTGNLLDYN